MAFLYEDGGFVLAAATSLSLMSTVTYDPTFASCGWPGTDGALFGAGLQSTDSVELNASADDSVNDLFRGATLRMLTSNGVSVTDALEFPRAEDVPDEATAAAMEASVALDREDDIFAHTEGLQTHFPPPSRASLTDLGAAEGGGGGASSRAERRQVEDDEDAAGGGGAVPAVDKAIYTFLYGGGRSGRSGRGGRRTKTAKTAKTTVNVFSSDAAVRAGRAPPVVLLMVEEARKHWDAPMPSSAATRSWDELVPKTDAERARVHERCGDLCFLVPDALKYPVCRKTQGTSADPSCAPDSRGLQGSRRRAVLVASKANVNKASHDQAVRARAIVEAALRAYKDLDLLRGGAVF